MLDSFYHYDIKINLKSYFRHAKRQDFAICMTLKALFHNISQKSVNH